MFNTIRRKWELLRSCISYVAKEYKWRDRSKYGLWDKTATMMKPVDLTALSRLYLYPFSRIQPGLNFISYKGKLIVKSYSAIGANATVITGNHVPTVGIPEFFLGTSHINDVEDDIIVEEGAWVGANVTLLRGAKIGRGAVVGACSLVNKEIPPYAVAVGMPAKIIATTYTLDQVIDHEKILFEEKDRLSVEYLRDLYESRYKGLKSIGTDNIDPSNLKKAEGIKAYIAQNRRSV